MSELTAFMTDCQERVEAALEQWLPQAHIHPARLHAAMRYAVLGGGKRIRPLLVYATGRLLGLPATVLDGPACAVELVHAYSLVHDDLPAMDNDDLRRGKPTCHRHFDEPTAILVGDSLQSLAFYILAKDPAMDLSGERRAAMIGELAMAAGSRGMAGGQAIDLGATAESMDIAELEDMHIHKTGALLRAAVTFGAVAAVNPPEAVRRRLDRYAKCVGLAFQIQDDILDVEGETAVLGKRQGADGLHDKPTYPALLGLEAAKERAQELLAEATQSLAPLADNSTLLRQIAEYVVDRRH